MCTGRWRQRSAAAALALAVLLLVPAQALAAWPGQFTDVLEWPAWALQGEATPSYMVERYVAWGGDLAEAVWWEIMEGYPPADGNPRSLREFRPQGTITRAEYATILARVLGLGVGVPPGDGWYRPAVMALAERGVVRDAGDWQAAIRRRELGEWVGRALAWYGADLSGRPERSFPDISGLLEAHYIQLATRADVIRGYPDGSYGPERTATRAEAAAMAVRLAKQLDKHAPTVAELEAVIRGWYDAITEVEKGWVETRAFDYGPLERYGTPVGIYGYNGFADATERYYAGRPGDGYAVLLSMMVSPIISTDFVVLLKLQRSRQMILPNGRRYPPVVGVTFMYLTVRDGEWKVSNIKRPSEYAPGFLPDSQVTVHG